MAPNNLNIIELTANIGHARVTAANTASDGSGSLSTLFTAGTEGSFVYRIRYLNSQATAAASSAMVIRFFLTDTGGANPRLLYEVALATATRSVSAVGAQGVITFPGRGLFLANGQLLQVIQSVYAGAQDQMDYTAEGGNL